MVDKRFFHVAFADAEMIPGENIVVNVIAGEFEGIYPAASFQMEFNPTELTFHSIQTGNAKTYHGQIQNQELPQWPCDPILANRDGCIRTMYLDLTAGEHALQFAQDKEKILFQLIFQVNPTLNPGDKVSLRFSQATFAAVDEHNSLSLQKGNIIVRNADYEIKERK